MFDFIPIYTDRSSLIMYPRPPDFDIGILTRPFTQERQVSENDSNATVLEYGVMGYYGKYDYLVISTSCFSAGCLLALPHSPS